MTISMYGASVPVFKRMLGNLDGILAKGLEHAGKRDIDPAVFFSARLYPDMFTLSRQVQIATDMAVRGACRLAGRELDSIPDNETTFEELRARIADAIKRLDAYRPEDIDGSEERDIKIKLRAGEVELTGLSYLQFFVLPNFYFHITTAYNILRHNGVELGKPDFMGSV